MSKRKLPFTEETESRRPRILEPEPCPRLPQELLDKIIDFSIPVDPLLGVLPHERHEPFISPFRRVNQACYRRVLSIISSLTWIELKGHLAFTLTKHIPRIDPFWVANYLQAEQTSYIVLENELGVDERLVCPEDDFGPVVVQYSFNSMLRIVCEINELYLSENRDLKIAVRSDQCTDAQFHEVELLLSLLLAKRVPPPTAKFSYMFQAPFLHDQNPVPDALSLYIPKVDFVKSKFLEQATSISRLQCMLVCLHLNRCAAYPAFKSNFATDDWYVALGRPDWQSNEKIKDYLRLMSSFHEFERIAFSGYRQLFRTNKEWTVWQSCYFTNGYCRWIGEPTFTYYGLPDNDMANYLHDAADATTLFLQINGRSKHQPLQEGVLSSNYSLYVEIKQRVYLYLCATALNPENEAWKEDHINAVKDWRRLFPYAQESWGDHYRIFYTDMKGKERTHSISPMFYRPYQALQYMHRAQYIVESVRDEARNSEPALEVGPVNG